MGGDIGGSVILKKDLLKQWKKEEQKRIIQHHVVMVNEITNYAERNKCTVKFAEIGVWKSGMVKRLITYCGDLIEQYWAVDPWKVMGPGHGTNSRRTAAQWELMHEYCCKLMRYYPQLKVMRLDSLTASKLFEDQPYFDIIYIDANHHYDFISADIRHWVGLVKKGGIISGHDYINNHRGQHVLRAVDEYFGKENVEELGGTAWKVQL